MDVAEKEILMKMKNELVTIRMLLEHQTAALERQVKLDHRECPFCHQAIISTTLKKASGQD